MALSGKYTTIERVFESVHIDYGLEFSIPFGDGVEWVADAMDLIGVVYAYETKITDGENGNPDPIVLEDYRGTLPCDIHSIQGMRDYDTKEPLIESTATFHKYHNETYDTNDFDSGLTYIIEGSTIRTNYEEGKLEIVYKAFPTDDRGLPKVPADTRYIKAIVAYVAEKIAFRLWGANKISERLYNNIYQKKCFKFKSAVSFSHIPSLDGAESLKNSLQKMIKHPNAHNTGFTYLGSQQQFKG